MYLSAHPVRPLCGTREEGREQSQTGRKSHGHSMHLHKYILKYSVGKRYSSHARTVQSTNPTWGQGGQARRVDRRDSPPGVQDMSVQFPAISQARLPVGKTDHGSYVTWAECYSHRPIDTIRNASASSSNTTTRTRRPRPTTTTSENNDDDAPVGRSRCVDDRRISYWASMPADAGPRRCQAFESMGNGRSALVKQTAGWLCSSGPPSARLPAMRRLPTASGEAKTSGNQSWKPGWMCFPFQLGYPVPRARTAMYMVCTICTWPGRAFACFGCHSLAASGEGCLEMHHIDGPESRTQPGRHGSALLDTQLRDVSTPTPILYILRGYIPRVPYAAPCAHLASAEYCLHIFILPPSLPRPSLSLPLSLSLSLPGALFLSGLLFAEYLLDLSICVFPA